jgi:hypothetical protein
VANAYAVATSSSGRECPIDVTLVFSWKAWKTSSILEEEDHFWDAVKGLDEANYNFRSFGRNLNDTVYKSWQYVRKFAYTKLPGGVFITNNTYCKVWAFKSEVVKANDDTDGWWESQKVMTLVTELGAN